MLCRRAYGYACPQPECDYFGNTDPTFHVLVGDGRRGADGIQWLKCRACGQCFSSRRGTALYRLRPPAAQVAQVLLAVNWWKNCWRFPWVHD